MPKIMADHDVEGHLEILLRIWTSSPWNELWQQLACEIESFRRRGIAYDTTDAELWRLCQQEGIVLITGNRNAESDEFLEATIQRNTTQTCLPVFTIANPARVLSDRDYAERVAERILEYLSDLDGIRGTGRLYVP